MSFSGSLACSGGYVSASHTHQSASCKLAAIDPRSCCAKRTVRGFYERRCGCDDAVFAVFAFAKLQKLLYFSIPPSILRHSIIIKVDFLLPSLRLLPSLCWFRIRWKDSVLLLFLAI
jgi:hypothetical protein